MERQEHDRGYLISLDKIIEHLRHFPFLLMTLGTLLVFTMTLRLIDLNKIEAVKYIFGVLILAPLLLHILFEVYKGRQERLHQPAGNILPTFSWKAITWFLFMLIAFGNHGNINVMYVDFVPYSVHDTTYVVYAFISLVCGALAWNDARKNHIRGKSLAIIDVII